MLGQSIAMLFLRMIRAQCTYLHVASRHVIDFSNQLCYTQHLTTQQFNLIHVCTLNSLHPRLYPPCGCTYTPSFLHETTQWFNLMHIHTYFEFCGCTSVYTLVSPCLTTIAPSPLKLAQRPNTACSATEQQILCIHVCGFANMKRSYSWQIKHRSGIKME